MSLYLGMEWVAIHEHLWASASSHALSEYLICQNRITESLTFCA